MISTSFARRVVCATCFIRECQCSSPLPRPGPDGDQRESENMSSVWKAFRSPAMQHKSWLHELEVEYAKSTFDTDPFEPQPDAARTIFPFWVQA